MVHPIKACRVIHRLPEFQAPVNKDSRSCSGLVGYWQETRFLSVFSAITAARCLILHCRRSISTSVCRRRSLMARPAAWSILRPARVNSSATQSNKTKKAFISLRGKRFFVWSYAGDESGQPGCASLGTFGDTSTLCQEMSLMSTAY